MWNLEYLMFGGAKFWNRDCKPATNWSCGVREGWEKAVAAALETIQPDLDDGSLMGVFLGVSINKLPRGRASSAGAPRRVHVPQVARAFYTSAVLS